MDDRRPDDRARRAARTKLNRRPAHRSDRRIRPADVVAALVGAFLGLAIIAAFIVWILSDGVW